MSKPPPDAHATVFVCVARWSSRDASPKPSLLQIGGSTIDLTTESVDLSGEEHGPCHVDGVHLAPSARPAFARAIASALEKS